MKKISSQCLASIVLIAPLAACGSMGGSSTDASSSASTAGASVSGLSANTGVASGSVDRGADTSTSTTTSTPASAGYTPPASATTSTVTSTSTSVAASTTPTSTSSATSSAPATTAIVPKTAATTPASSGAVGTTPTPPISTPTAPVIVTPTVVKKSISGWVSCSGTSDDNAGATAAFAAAKQGAFTLVVDCPVKISSGLDIARGIFIDNGTTVEFTGNGKFFVDNMFHPAFVIANSSNIVLTNWNVEWDGSVPVSPNFGGYVLNGKFIAGSGQTQPAGAFNDQTLTTWLSTNRGVTFLENQGWVKSQWVGGVNPAAVFFITGDTSNVVISGMKMYVPTTVGGDHFIPMAFSFSPNWKSNQTVTGKSAHTAQNTAIPHNLTFSGVDFDGTYMGWQGNAAGVMFENITSHRYGDLQDANGNNVGGIGKWFPPPHLFYLNYITTGDPGLFNTNIHISNVVDSGPRIGTARDKGGSDTRSGYANSLKLGCTDCTVDQYNTNRPDGFMDVLPSDNLTVSNVVATWDSTFLNNLYPGWRWPLEGYTRVAFENIQLKDVTAVSTYGPIGNAPYQTNSNITFTNVQVSMTKWGGSDLPVPNIVGANNNVLINYSMTGDPSKATSLQQNAVVTTLQAMPSTISVGSSTTLKWSSKEATGCAASGPWSGSLGTSGSKSVKMAIAGNYDFTITCQNSGGSTATTVQLTVQ